MKLPSFRRDSWLIAIAMGGLCLFALPNSPAPATSPSASPSSPPSSPPTSPPAPELPLLDKLQSNLPMLNSKLEAVINALGGVNTKLTPEQLRLAWTNIDAQVDQLCTQTVSPLKKRIEEENKKDTTYKTIADLFNQIETTCNNINLKTNQLKPNSQQSSEPQPTVDSPETNIKQELQNIKQLLNQVKEWVSQEQEKKYRESLDKRLDLQNQYLQIGLFLLIVLGLIVIAVVLYKKGDKTVTGGDGKIFEETTINKNNTGFNGLPEKETLNNINQYVEQSLRENGEKIDKWLKERQEKLSTIESELQEKLTSLEKTINDLKNQRTEESSNIESNLTKFTQKLTILEQKINNSTNPRIENNDELKKFLQDDLRINFGMLWEELKKQTSSDRDRVGHQQIHSDEFIDEIQNKLLAGIHNLIKDQVDQSFNSCIETKLIPLINQEYESQKLNLIANLRELVPILENDTSSSQELNNEQIQELLSQLEQRQKDLKTAEDSVQELQSQQSQTQTTIQQLETKLREEQEKILKLQSNLKTNQDNLETLKKEIKTRDNKIGLLEYEKTNAEQKNKADETKKTQNQTQVISQELRSLVNKYNQNNGDLNVLNDPIPVKDNSEILKDDYKLQKTEQDKAKFYIVSCQDKHYLFPKLNIPSEATCDILRYHFEVPQYTYPVSIKLIQPPEVKQMSGTKDNWELVDKCSKGKVK